MTEAAKQQSPTEKPTNLAQVILAKVQHGHQMVSPWVQRQLALDDAAHGQFPSHLDQADRWANAIVQRFARNDGVIARHQRNLFTFAAARRPQLPLAKSVGGRQQTPMASEASQAGEDWQAEGDEQTIAENSVESEASLPSTASIAAMIRERIQRANAVDAPAVERPSEYQLPSFHTGAPAMEDESSEEEAPERPYSITAMIRERIQRAEAAHAAKLDKPTYPPPAQQGVVASDEPSYSVAAMLRERIQRAANEPIPPSPARKSAAEAQSPVQAEEAKPERLTNLAATMRERIQRAQAERHHATSTKQQPVPPGYIEPPLATGYQSPNPTTAEHEANPRAMAGKQTGTSPAAEEVAPASNVIARQVDLTPAASSIPVQSSMTNEESTPQPWSYVDASSEKRTIGEEQRSPAVEALPPCSVQATVTPETVESDAPSSQVESADVSAATSAAPNLTLASSESKTAVIEPSQNIQRQPAAPSRAESLSSPGVVNAPQIEQDIAKLESGDVALPSAPGAVAPALVEASTQSLSPTKEGIPPVAPHEQSTARSDQAETDAAEQPAIPELASSSMTWSENGQPPLSAPMNRPGSSDQTQHAVQRTASDQPKLLSSATASPVVTASRDAHVVSPSLPGEKTTAPNAAIVQTPSSEVRVHRQTVAGLSQETSAVEQPTDQQQTIWAEHRAVWPDVIEQAAAESPTLLTEQTTEEAPVPINPAPLAVTQRMAQRRSLAQYGEALAAIGSQMGAQPPRNWASDAMTRGAQLLPLVGAMSGVSTARDVAAAAQSLRTDDAQAAIQQQAQNLIEAGLQSEPGQQAQHRFMAGASDALAWAQNVQATGIANAAEQGTEQVPPIQAGEIGLPPQTQLTSALNIVRHPLNLPAAARLPTAETVVATSAQLLSALPKRQAARKPADLDALARQVYPLIKRMLAVERERRPLG